MPCSGPSKVHSDIEGSQIFSRLIDIFNEYGITMHENKQNRIMFKALKEQIQEIVFYQRCLDF